MNDEQRYTAAPRDRRVLVVDDDQDFADTLCRLLALEGYEVERAYRVAAVPAVLESFRAEAALVDIRMEEKSGLDLVAELRRQRPEIACILMTAYASAESAIEALQAGAYDYLRKPFHTEDLLATLGRCFERIALARGREQAESALRLRNRELEALNARLRDAATAMQALSAQFTLRGLCLEVLERVAGATGARRGLICLDERGGLVVKQRLGPEAEPAGPAPPWVESLFDRLSQARRPVEASGPDGGATGSGLAFPLFGERQELVGMVAVQGELGRHFTLQDREIGEILVSFAGEAVRLVRAHEDLARGERRLREIIDNSPSLICLKDRSGRYLVVNRRFEEWHGFRRDEVVGRTSDDLFPPELARVFAEQDREVLGGQISVDREIEIPFADGELHSVRVTKFSVLGADGRPTGVGAIGTDITGPKRAEAQLRQAQKMEAIGQLTGGIAHDFNNLLAVISGNVDLIRDEVGGDPGLADLADDALAAARSGAELTHRLLAFGRGQTLHPEPTDAGRLVDGMSRMLERALGETIETRRVGDEGLWPVEIDRNQLETSLLNLAINARDAMPLGGTLTIETANAVVGRDDAGGPATPGDNVPGDYVRVSVMDSGTGMPPGIVEQSIQPFFTTKALGQGSGLGLSMVYGFVKQSGGHMEIKSAPGGGTTVALYLPRAQAAAIPDGAPADRLVESGGRGERILVVEDEAAVRKTAVSILARLGYEVVEAADGRRALGALDGDSRIDLLFTDVVLPGDMSGVELARRARARYPALKILYTSGYAQDADLQGDLVRSGSRLVKKPFAREQLARAVREALESGPR